jgi:hypothetical protein
VGATELGARYRDDPVAALRTLPGLAYVMVNVVAAVAALVIVKAFGWTFGLGPNTSVLQVQVVQVLVAGVGSAALFRSSLFTVRQGDQEIGIGPSAILTGLLGLVDRGVDRQRALERLSRDDLEGLSFDRDYVTLTELCTGALQNPDKADAQALGELAARLRDEPGLSDAGKLDVFALKLLTLVGPKAIKAAAERVRKRRSAEPVVSDAASGPAAVGPAEQDAAWRERMALLSYVVERPVSVPGPMDAALELAWLQERLEQHHDAQQLYEELAAAVQSVPSLTDHELMVAWSRVQISAEKAAIVQGLAIVLGHQDIADRLVKVCTSPGARPACYAAALYMLAQLPETSNDQALGYLTDGLKPFDGVPHPHSTYGDIRHLLSFARARCYLAQGNTEAAAEDLALASMSADRELQIISSSLSSLLQDHLPDNQANALWRVIEPFGFVPLGKFRTPPFGKLVHLRIFPTESERVTSLSKVMSKNADAPTDDNDETRIGYWHRFLADGLKERVPLLVPDNPLRTFDLIRSDEEWRPPPSIEDGATNPVEMTNWRDEDV